jgi:hypothetical protein
MTVTVGPTMSAALRTARVHQAATHARCLATASGSSLTKSAFKATLAAGPSFGEFLTDQGNERVVLGNTSG